MVNDCMVEKFMVHMGWKIPGLKHEVLDQNVLQPSEKDKKSKKKEKIATPKTIAVVENFKLKVAVLPDSISKIMSKSIEKVTTQSFIRQGLLEFI